MSVWLLTAGQYSDYHVVGAFATETQAREVLAAVDDGEVGDRFMVEEVPILSPKVRPILRYTAVRLQFAIHWDGKIRYDTSAPDAPSWARAEPVSYYTLTDIDDGDNIEAQPPACVAEVHAFERDYTLGVDLTVGGTDIERVRKVFSEKRAQLVADPATSTVVAWAKRSSIPNWVWVRAENAGIVDALRRAGVK